MPWFELAVLILASFRLTHLFVFDSITEPLRRPLQSVPFLGDLITCYWCTGVWVSALSVLSFKLWPHVAGPVLLAFAVAGGQALVERWVERQ